MGERDLSMEVSRGIRPYFIHFIDYHEGIGGFDYGSSCSERSIPVEMMKVIDEISSELYVVLEEHLGVTQTYASRYMMLPSILRDFFDSGPECMFILGSKVNEAVVARVVVEEICSLVMRFCKSCDGGLNECFVFKTKSLLKESGLYVSCD